MEKFLQAHPGDSHHHTRCPTHTSAQTLTHASFSAFFRLLFFIYIFFSSWLWRQIFSKYVVAMVQNSATKTSEIKELSELRETLGLDGLLMGEALHQVRGGTNADSLVRVRVRDGGTNADDLAVARCSWKVRHQVSEAGSLTGRFLVDILDTR